LPAAFDPVLLPDDVPVVAGDTFTPCDNSLPSCWRAPSGAPQPARRD